MIIKLHTCTCGKYVPAECSDLLNKPFHFYSDITTIVSLSHVYNSIVFV